MMAISTLFVVSLLFSSIAAHTFLTNIVVNGQFQDACVQPHGNLIDYPMSDISNPSGLQSNLMTCGRTRGNAQSKCSVPVGSTVGFQWHYYNERNQLGETYILDPSHIGPCLVYMARSDTGTGPVWFKIFQDGYNGQSFCTTRLIANRGLFNATIPSDLAPGNYLIRVELIALHEGHLVGGAQPYVHCAELTITGSGTSNPSSNLVSFPGAYQARDAGIYFNPYNGFRTYPIPGPELYQSAAVISTSSSSSTTGRSSTSTSSTTGRSSSSSSTTGRTSSSTSSTTGRASTSTSSTTGSVVSSGTSTGSSSVCELGKQQCLSSETYRICMKSGNTYYWSPEQSCRSGDTCHQTDDYIFCY